MSTGATRRPAVIEAVAHSAVWAPVLVAFALLAPMVVRTISGCIREPQVLAAPFERWSELRGSLLYAASIATLAVVAAWPVAWATRGWRAARAWAIAAPLLLPSYLAYAGWTMLRAPGTPVGDALLRLSERDGFAWAPMATGRALAVWGLALWVWPIAALVLRVGWERVSDTTLDALRLEQMTARRRALTRLRLVLPAAIAAWSIVVVVMLGSAIPLHVAQAKTHAIGIWLALDQCAPDERWRVWAAGWPLVLVGFIAAAILTRGLTRTASEAPESRPSRARWRDCIAPCVVLGLSIGLPVALFAVTGWRGIDRFVRLADDELRNAAIQVAIASAYAMVLAVSSARLASLMPRTVTGVFVVLLGVALTPGVLIGAAVSSATLHWPDRGVLGLAPLLLAQTARFAFLPVAAGLWTALSESRDLRDSRSIDRATSWRGWWRGRGSAALAPLALAALATAMLCLQEIEAAVQVYTPGVASLPRLLLNYLHFARDEDLSAAVALLAGVGLVGVAMVSVGTWILRPAQLRSGRK